MNIGAVAVVTAKTGNRTYVKLRDSFLRGAVAMRRAAAAASRLLPLHGAVHAIAARSIHIVCVCWGFAANTAAPLPRLP